MFLENAMNLIAHLILQQSLSCYPRADWQNLYSDDAHLPIGQVLAIYGIEVGQEWYVRVESNTDTVYEQDREPGSGGVRPVPVCESSRRRTIGREQSEQACGEDCEKSKQRRAVEGEGIVAQIDRR